MFTTSVCLVLCLIYPVRCYDSYRLSGFTKPEDYMMTCMRGILQKEKPGPEADLWQQCKPWKDRSCCTEDVTNALHVNKTWYKVDYSHCRVPMSDKCAARFKQNDCFYECSPNVGPWLVKDDNTNIRTEQFINVPLCQTECDAWWEDCVDDYTCVDNWSRKFDWSSGTAQCPANTECRTFREVFGNSTNFCQKIWDHSWKVVKDTDPNGCFVMWWNEGVDNPNYQVALKKAEQLVSDANSLPIVNLLEIVSFIACVFIPSW